MSDNIIPIDRAPSFADRPINPDTLAASLETMPQQNQNALRLTKRGRFVLALTGLTAGVFGIGEAKDKVTDYLQDQKEQSIEQVSTYQQTGELESGKVVIQADKVGVAEQFATQVGSGENTKDLVGDIHAQTDAQGDPGVQPGEIAVVDAEQVDPTSPQIIDSNLTPQ